ncbi:hypothetical protein ABW02_12770 [Niallia circulans]|uniref:Polysaccharide pyruvyl transferase domain-containing protein n=1 Tax=Niallia circulans TaxID=1397 RepID=A0A0J1IJ32_NIACI|nr:polysaccharide pyruvyl transferase family protein [Niallia circulans]KLV25961.1 hypothetical protein ABW02_12770 [Niallia circulans]
MQVSLWGYYGINYGDDIMMIELLNYFNKRKVRVQLIDLFNANLEEQLKGKYDNLQIINFNLLNYKEKKKVIRECSKNKINLWGGGTIFTDVDGDGNFKWFSLIKLFGGKIGYVGVGIGKLTRIKRVIKTKLLLNWSSLTIFREKKSLNRAKALFKKGDYLLAEDISYKYFERFKLPESELKSRKKYLLITWRNLNKYLDKNKELIIMEKIADKCSEYIGSGRINNIILAALDINNDLTSCQELKSLFENRNIESSIICSNNIDENSRLILEANIHISGRLHGSVASEFFKTPTISLSYSPKMNYFYESIKTNNYLDIYTTNFEEDELFNNILNNKKSVDFSSIVKKSEENFRYIENFLFDNKN